MFPSRVLHYNEMINATGFTCRSFKCWGWSVCVLELLPSSTSVQHLWIYYGLPDINKAAKLPEMRPPLLVKLYSPSTPSGSWFSRVLGRNPSCHPIQPVTDKSLRLSLSQVSERDTNSGERRDERQQRQVIPHCMLDKAPDVPDKSQSKHTTQIRTEGAESEIFYMEPNHNTSSTLRCSWPLLEVF